MFLRALYDGEKNQKLSRKTSPLKEGGRAGRVCGGGGEGKWSIEG